MMRKSLAIAWKELRLWLQSPGNWLVVFLVPFAFIGVFGSVFKEGSPVVTVFAVNEDQGELGEEIIDMLRACVIIPLLIARIQQISIYAKSI